MWYSLEQAIVVPFQSINHAISDFSESLFVGYPGYDYWSLIGLYVTADVRPEHTACEASIHPHFFILSTNS